MNDWERQHRQAQQYKDAYPPGTRLMLLCMNDPPHPVESGTRGTVEHVDDMGTIHMSWDNGRTLGIVPGEDEFRRLTQEEIDQELRDQAQEQSIGFCVRSGFTPAPFLLPQKNHRTRRIPPGTAPSDSPAARRKYTLWQHPRGCRRCSSDGTAWDQCPDTRRTCSR